MRMQVGIIGAGLAGSEAAWQLAERGFDVTIFEQKPERRTPAQKSDHFAELVCSNSFRGDDVTQAVGLLKREMESLGSLIIAEGRANAVAAGGALAVDRDAFSAAVTARLQAHPRIEIVQGEITRLPDCRPLIIATGPLTSDGLASELENLVGDRSLAFYDAIAPIVTGESLDREIVFAASRYGKGGGDDYLNCPLTESQYDAFLDALLAADKVAFKSFENIRPFEGCLPIEEMAERGRKTLAFGPMKPVGLVDPRTGERPHAVVQLRREDRHGQLWNLVGFQTKLTYPEQKRVFAMIPGLAGAEFVRLGSVHRNTFINAPALLTEAQELRSSPGIYFAGQITGVEGYVESAAGGLLAAMAVDSKARGEAYAPPPPTTALGGLIRHLTESNPRHYQPMNVSFGLMDPLPYRLPKDKRRPALAERALRELEEWRNRRAA
jgi:methylenetetrahydrofolate--tRNA-(uracil-5-)-methyltransferase